MEKNKIKYGKTSIGCYCTLYTKFLWFYMPDTHWGTSSTDVNRAERQATEWKERYSISADLVIRKDV